VNSPVLLYNFAIEKPFYQKALPNKEGFYFAKPRKNQIFDL